MAFYDWNHDGKKDTQDDFIEYNIYKKQDKNRKNSSGNGGMSGMGALLLTIAVFFLLGGLFSLSQPKCAKSGCHNKPAEGSSYCTLHDTKYRYGGNSSQYGGGNTGNGSNSSTSSDYNQVQKTPEPTQTPNRAVSFNTPIPERTPSAIKSDEDPYDAKSYSDAGDFYDDNYDAFESPEDAEDYYDEYGE